MKNAITAFLALIALTLSATAQQTVTLPGGSTVTRSLDGTMPTAPYSPGDTMAVASFSSCNFDFAVTGTQVEIFDGSFHGAVRALQIAVGQNCDWMYQSSAADSGEPYGTLEPIADMTHTGRYPIMEAEWVSGGITYRVRTDRRGNESGTHQAERHVTAVQQLAAIVPPDSPNQGE